MTYIKNYNKIVAPRVGAWIETSVGYVTPEMTLGRTPCGCVD